MKLQLDRDIIFFDLESTGLNIIKDRIIQYAFIKKYADGRLDEQKTDLVNPGAVLISEESQAIHGISNDMVARKPQFAERADEIMAFIGDSDIAGYNSNRFDIPMLMEELARAGHELKLDGRRVIDVQTIFHKMEPRTLEAAHKKFTGKPMENAHDALADVKATIAVLEGQLDAYDGVDLDHGGKLIPTPIKNDMEALHEFTQDHGALDITRRLKYDPNGTVVFNFGKYIGRPVGRVSHEDPNYFHWIQNKEFSIQVKKLVKQLRDEHVASLKADPQ